MGVFLQNALFPGCDKTSARAAAEAAAKNPDFKIDPDRCEYAQSYEGTQVLMDGDALGFAPLARALSQAAVNPVMLLYVYDGDYWGYDFYGGNEEDHFSALPDYFGPVSREEKRRLAGNPAALAGWFPIRNPSDIQRYLIHWSDEDPDELEGAGPACPGDRFSYGDCWQMTDFAARLGFPWPFDEAKGFSPPPPLPALREILERDLPPLLEDMMPEEHVLIHKLPSSLSHDYIRNLLEEDGVREFGFADMTPREIIEAVYIHRRSVRLPEADPLCQRLAALAAFCGFWLSDGSAWGFLDRATYEPLYGSYEKPTDVYVLRARVSLADFSKRYRALKDLNRLAELDPANRELYQAEISKLERRERAFQERRKPRLEAMLQQYDDEKRREEEKEAQRLRLILEKRRKKGKRNSP